MTLQEMLQERARLIARAREIHETAEAENRNLTEEETTNYNQAMNDAQDLHDRVERARQVQGLEEGLNESFRQDPTPDARGGLDYEFRSRSLRHLNDADPAIFQDEMWQRLFPWAQDGYRGQFRNYLRTGAQPQLTAEQRALYADADIYGGALVPPIQFVDRLIQAVDNMVYMRQWGNFMAVPNADSLGAVSLDNDPADPTWVSELTIGSEDSTMSFGKRELKPHPLSQFIKVSRKLLRQVPDVDGLVIRRLGYKDAVVKENAYLNGLGNGHPLGVFVASDYGISTGRDVSTGNDATSIKFDGLINAKYTLKQQYWPKAKWLFHRDGQKQIATLKDGNGQYLWRESVRVGEPDMVLGFPTFMSEYAPNTFTTGLYVGILGDFSYYWGADALDMEIQRLVELYAGTNQVGMIMRSESDGMPVLAEAFVRVKLG